MGGPTPLPALPHPVYPGPPWWPAGTPTLGCPLGEVQPRGCWAEPFATYWCGVSVGLGCRGAGLCRGAPSTHLGQWVLRPGEAPAPAGRSCCASLLTLSASSHLGTLWEPEGSLQNSPETTGFCRTGG